MQFVSTHVLGAKGSALRVRYSHGPDRDLLARRSDGVLVSASGVPFHGIPSRAAIADLAESGREWNEIHDAGIPSDWLAEREVLTLTESATIATAALARMTGDTTGTCELWNIKEGQTASVWVAFAPSVAPCVLNVGRDPLASAELAAVTERLRKVDLSPDRLATVVDEHWVDWPTRGTRQPVFVAAQQLIDDALEIHRIDGRYAMVERFLTDPQRHAHITAMRGRWAMADEAETIDDLCEAFARAAAPLGLELAVNDGDLVWAEGRGPVVVAAGLTAGPDRALAVERGARRRAGRAPRRFT